MRIWLIQKWVLNIFLVQIIILSGFFNLINLMDWNNSSVSGTSIIIVSNSPKGDYSSIQDAIDNSNPGDTISVWNGTYFENIVINKRLNLIGNGSKNTTIDGRGSGDVVDIRANRVSINGFKIIK